MACFHNQFFLFGKHFEHQAIPLKRFFSNDYGPHRKKLCLFYGVCRKCLSQSYTNKVGQSMVDQIHRYGIDDTEMSNHPTLIIKTR